MALSMPHMLPTSKTSWKRCKCCPYGYHIDLDFVRYCESITSAQLEPAKRSARERRHGRKNRASMEVLLGIPNSPQVTGVEPISKSAQQVGDALQRAVLDFEKTLQRSGQQKYSNGWAEESGGVEMKGDWLGGGGAFWRKRSLRKVSPQLPPSPEQAISPVTNEGEQMASSFVRINELEEHVKQVLKLQSEVNELKKKNDDLILQLKIKDEIIKSGHHQDRKAIWINEYSKGSIPEENSYKTRDISIGCSVITREVGVMHRGPFLVTRTTETSADTSDECEKCRKETESVSLQTVIQPIENVSSRSINIVTDLKMEQIYTSVEVERSIENAIKIYEKTLQPSQPSKKLVALSVGTQTGKCFKELEQKDKGIQVKHSSCEFGVLVKPRCSDFIIQIQPQTKDVGVWNNRPCQKCSARKAEPILPEIKKSSKSVACGHEKSTSISKSTDTVELNEKKDVSINTTKRKLVDACIEACDLPCLKCINQISTGCKASVSRIPRPTTLAFSPQSKSFSRQDLPKTLSQTSKRKLHNEECTSDSSEDGACNAMHKSISRTISMETPLFQTINADSDQKSEPSKEMKAAMKVLNDSLLTSTSTDVAYQMKNAINIIQQEWFKVSSTASANPLEVEYYLDCFEELSSALLEYIVNMTDVTGNTAMHYAISHGNFDVVSILLDSKVCNINRSNAAGYTCIMLVSLAQVCSETHRQVVRRLFHMADVNIRAKQHGQTALMLAVSHGRIETVELLLESGADINIQDEDGSTALMCAAEHGHIDIVKLLLAHPECDVTIADFDGSTALNIAMEGGNRDIGVLLYAQEHFSRGSSPYTSLKQRRTRSSSQNLKTPPPRTPTSPHSSKEKQLDHSF